MTAARSVVWTTLSGSADSHVFVSTARSDARFRRAVRHRGHFPNEQAAMKVLYLVANRKRPNRPDLIGKINGWKEILNALTIHYGERLAAV